jgi:O-antigen/teichoic acid export membrane protein
MGIVVKKSFKTVFSTYIGIGLGIINTIWLFPLILTTDEIGFVRTIVSVSALFATFASLGSFTLPMKFFPYLRDERVQHHGFLFFILFIGGIGFILFTVIFLLFESTISQIYSANSLLLVQYLNLFIPFTGVVLGITILESYLVALFKPVIPNIAREIVLRILLLFSLLVYSFKLVQQEGFFYSVFFTYCFVLILLVVYAKKENVLFLRPNFTILKNKHFHDMAVFCSFVFVGNVSGLILLNIDTLMLSAYSGLKQTGIYSIAFFIATFIEVPKRSLSQVLIPLIGQASKDSDVKMLETVYKKSSINQLLIGAGLLVLIWSNIDTIFMIIPNGHIYAAGKWVILIIGLSKLFDMVTGVNGEIIGTSPLYKYDLIFFVFLAIIGTVLSMILIPKYGLVGAAFSAAIAIVIFNTMRSILIYSLYKIHPFSIRTMTALLVISLTILLNTIIPVLSKPIIDLLLRSIILVTFFLFSMILLNVSVDITNIFHRALSRFGIH